MNEFFPATYTSLCPDALSKLINQKYDFGNVTCKLMVRGVSDTYLVNAKCDHFILRVYRNSHRNYLQIAEEVKLLLTLKEAGISVSYPIADRSGQTIQKLNAVEGERCAVIFSYADGEAVRILSEAQLLSFGREMARFHNVSADLPKGEARWEFNIETTLIKPLSLIRPAFVDNQEDYEWLQWAVNKASEKLSLQDDSALSKGYCHFDFLPKNIHFKEAEITFFDFDFMGHGWLINDIMTYWQHLAIHVFAGRMNQRQADGAFAIFLGSYRDYREVSNEELALIPYLTLGFWLYYMGFHTTHDQFHSFTLPSQVKEFTGLIRFIVATYWDKGDIDL